MLTNRDIIITGIQSWDISIGSNCKNIALEFSKYNRVIYVNPPLDRLTILRQPDARQKMKQKRRDNDCGLLLNRVSSKLWVFQPEIVIESISRLPFNELFDVVNRLNNIRFAKSIRKALNHLNFKNYIHFCDSDMFRSYHLKKLIKPALSVYYTRDNLMAVKFWQKQGARIEPKHMEKADLILGNSEYLAQQAQRYNPNSYFVGQGCNLSAFDPNRQYHMPDDLKKSSRPLIGYIGALKTLRLDIRILQYVAEKRPDWTIVLVGPEDVDFKKSDLHQLANVHFVGSKREFELPFYLNALDVAINPQTINEVTIGNYPRKIDEYLAMGKPVVATPTQAMGYFADHVYLPDSLDKWVNAIEQALKENTKERQDQRINFASSHSWDENVKEIGRRILQREEELRKAVSEVTVG